jgi:hypothetical protein
MHHRFNVHFGASLLLTCASFAPASAASPVNGQLFIFSSTYTGNANTLKVGQMLPINPPVAAIANGAYPGVFANDTVDGNFGITSPITLSAYQTANHGAAGTMTSGLIGSLDITTLTGVSTSFSSKSEGSINLSNDGTALTFMGYLAQPNQLDVSNANTPGRVDPTNTDIQKSTYRAVVQVNLSGGVSATKVNAYSGNNGRAAVLANDVNGTGINEYLMAGNGGNGSGIPPTDIVDSTGVQSIAPGAASPATTVIGAKQGTAGEKDGFQFGFSVTSLGDPADKSGKDNNFRGLTLFDNILFVTKGSGSNGINTVYQVTPKDGGLPTPAGARQTQISILPGLPTGLAANITEGDAAAEFYPFGIFFANATTLYVADEGSQDLNADPNAGLQKWIFDGSVWKLAYTIQTGLNLDTPYSVPNYPSQYNPATTGLRNISGTINGNVVTIFAVTATYSNLGDPGADPNQVVRVVDLLDATTLPAGETFTSVVRPAYGHVFRGVAFVPCPYGTACGSALPLATR